MFIPMWFFWVLVCLFGGMVTYIVVDIMGWTIAVWGEEDEGNEENN